MYQRRLTVPLAIAAAVLVVGAQRCAAHFPWLATDEEGHALLFFSENPAERDYNLPESVERAKVTAQLADGKAKELKMASVIEEEQEFIGCRSAEPAPAGALLTTSCQYGVYHGTLLEYYAKYAPSLKRISDPQKDGLKLDAVIKPVGRDIQIHVLWEGKPLEGADVTILDPSGDTLRETSNKEGLAIFRQPSDGLVGVIVGRMIADSSGKVDDAEYTSESHYLTVAWNNVRAPKAAVTVPPLPEAVASFGAAVSDGWLYVYSGHIGTAHDHSRENLSKHFRRVRLGGGSGWEELPMQTPLQGLPLVAHGGKLYRAGGLAALNASGEEEDLHSSDEFACFDPATKKWTALPPLPAPRSSHDAVVIGDKLYVVGGWELSGSSDGKWHDTMCVVDLNDPQAGWQELAGPPVRRRALAVAHAGEALVVLGGMDDDNEITQRVDCFDPSTRKWTQLADYPGDGFHGFGVSAWSCGGRVCASGYEGVVYQLDDNHDLWRAAATLDTPRFFHRLLPGPGNSLLAVAGASRQGHLAGVERVALK